MRRFLAMTVLGVFVAACGNEAKGPSTSEYEAARKQKLRSESSIAANGAKKPPTKTASASPESGAGGIEKGYTYDATGKRDPFRSFVLEEAAKRNKGDRGPLEQLELGQISLQAVVWGTEKPRALVADPQGRGYIVKEGTPIGKSSGQITRIGDNMLVVREIYEDTLGGRTEKDIEMRIRQSQGG
jgi:type IV pilus assembly protein PilP